MVLAPHLAGRTVLVTGATGFIGSGVCRRLCEIGADVHGVSRTPQSRASLLRWWQGDLTDRATVQNLLKAIKPELIFHLSGYAHAGRELDLVLPTFYSNLATTVNVLTVATELGFRRMVLTGSLEEPKPGDPEIAPSSPYAAAKWASGAYARMFHRLYRAPIVLVRLFMTYGPGERRPNKLIPYVTRSLLQGERPRLTSGERRIDWVYIDDVVAGILAAGQAPDVEGCTIDLGSGVLVSIRTVVEHLLRLAGARVEPIFGALPDRVSEQERVADTAYALAKLDWRPSISLEDGLARTVDWHRDDPAIRARTAPQPP